jgi:hypothetical protein
VPPDGFTGGDEGLAGPDMPTSLGADGALPTVPGPVVRVLCDGNHSGPWPVILRRVSLRDLEPSVC